MSTSICPESKNRKSNEKKFGIHSDSCIVCGKRTKQKFFVHLLTTGEITTEENHPESQGLFPIGPECKKLIEEKFIF